MFDHFEIKTINYKHCKEFYSKVLLPLKIELKWSDETAAGFGCIGSEKVGFLIEKSDNQTALHIAFTASDIAAVKLFHDSGIKNGFVCNGKPGIRDNYAPNYYAAFLLDPDGNNVEAVAYT